MQCVFSVIVKRRSIRTLFMAFSRERSAYSKALGCMNVDVAAKVASSARVYPVPYVSALDRTLSDRS